MVTDRFYLHAALTPVIWFLTSCAVVPAMVKVLVGAFVGVIPMQILTEIAWRLGLRFGVPDPSRTLIHLAARDLPYLPAKEQHRGRRRLIICCDGTWNWPEARRETNVVRLVRSITPDDNGIAQIVHYHQGVGTGNVVDRIAGGGAGIGLSASVKACYGFLVDNYKQHDDILLFGFSRGAYVARALSGLIGAVGMMRKHEMDRFADMWNWYWQAADKRDIKVLDRIAPARTGEVEIECIGVWDTVGALGIPGSPFCAGTYAFHQTELGLHVRHAFQALAIDERRGNFQGAVWVPFDPHQPHRTATVAAARRAQQAQVQQIAGQPAQVRQVLKQVWFPGVHSNIGGGYPEHGLSDTTFLWMLSELESHQLLAFDPLSIAGALDADHAERYPAGALADSRTPFFRLIGCPVPRPVCVISNTERVHDSAWQRRAASRDVVPNRDIYKRPRRGKWLDAMAVTPHGQRDLEVLREPFEVRFADGARPTDRPAENIPKKLDLCSWLLQPISGRG
jgi:uncharacterized protein (DUF2235 family)